MHLERTEHQLNPVSKWYVPLAGDYKPDHNCMDYFDQNGYDLSPLEELYAIANDSPIYNIRWRRAVCKDWFTSDSIDGVHINHAALFERKGYEGLALYQLKQYAKEVPIIHKLIHMKPKWGIDISIDYVDESKAFEVFHYEWDDFDFQTVVEKQEEIEQLVMNVDWEYLTNVFWNKRDEWMHLDFDGQTKYKTDYLGLSPERFKLVAWTLDG